MRQVLSPINLQDPRLPPQDVVLLFENVDLSLSLSVLTNLLVYFLPHLLSIFVQMFQVQLHVKYVIRVLLILLHQASVVFHQPLDLELLALRDSVFRFLKLHVHVIDV